MAAAEVPSHAEETAMTRRAPHTPMALCAAALALSAPALAQNPAGDGGPATTSAPMDYRPLDAILRAAVRPTGVDYGAVRARLAELRAFHDGLAAVGPRSTPARFTTSGARRAYWLNAYNATVLRGVAEAPAGLRSVQDLAPDFGFFRRRRWSIDGRELTLDQIEHGELLEVFHDPRFHMGLNCGARSCPPLRASAYDPARVDRQLDEQSSRYVNAPGSVVIDEAAHRVTVVQLFEWFARDLERPVPGRPPSGARGPIGFVYSFAAPALRARLTAVCGADGAGCTLAHPPYDWALNSSR